MTTSPILVLGGTGKTGRRVAARLRAQGRTPRVASRSGETRFDWADETTWKPALSGVGAAYLVDSQDADAATTLRAFSELAAAHGVERLVLLSARVWAEMGAPSAAEQAVRESGTAWTILRPTWFMQNFSEDLMLTGPVAAGDVRLPTGEGKEPFVDLEDVADVAVAALTGEGHEGEIYELSGPEAITWREAVAEVARASGRAIGYTPLSLARYREEAAALGYPAEYAALLGELFDHISQGRAEHTSDGVQRVLGREPGDFASYARRMGGAFPRG
ncbi:NAD(P)H-binding protein [Nonomuraea sp. NPDC049152]|uniref:NAD(P)H-binding protein n=1 Tax=Nonomuraea sp. NPDC049152 TaxID=3154350 RepID=UPI0033D2AA4D